MRNTIAIRRPICRLEDKIFVRSKEEHLPRADI